jgi:hypothetical protein
MRHHSDEGIKIALSLFLNCAGSIGAVDSAVDAWALPTAQMT